LALNSPIAPDVPADATLRTLLAAGTDIVCVDDLLVRRNLPAAIRNLREALG
jgi:hypothetical protein